jgi:Trk K+ transport system NAD-binding subunit
MKFMISQLAALLDQSKQHTNAKLLIRFAVILFGIFLLNGITFHFIMEMEGQKHSWLTGFYWTLTVMTTLGFGDITFTSDFGRFFSMLVMLSGVIFLLVMLPFTFIQFLYAPWLEAQNKARAPRKVPEDMSGHVILTYFDAVAQNLVEKLEQYNIPYAILVPDLQQALHLYEEGFNVVLGDVDAPETYHRLRVEHAALVVIMNGDVASTNIVFTVHEAAEQVPTVTNADNDDSLDILRLAGSTHTFQFTKMLGQVLARRVLGLCPQANLIGQLDELRIAESPAMCSPLQGLTLAQSRLRELTGVNVVGLWEKGRFYLPTPTTLIGPSTVLVLAGSPAQLQVYDDFIGSPETDCGEKKPVLVLGGGRVGMSVAQTLSGRGIDYRVVEKNPSLAKNDERIISGSAADLNVLIEAGINDTPSIIITTHDDDLNIFLTIYCRRLRPDVQIICRASLDRNINTMHRAGANLVMSFASLVSTTILNLLKPEKLLMISEGLNIFRSRPGRNIAGKALYDLRVREETGCSIIAIKRNGKMRINPEPSTVITAEDKLILIGTAEAERSFIKKYISA